MGSEEDIKCVPCHGGKGNEEPDEGQCCRIVCPSFRVARFRRRRRRKGRRMGASGDHTEKELKNYKTANGD